ncbi:MAG: hypothetical protein HC822_16605 [Oscillochloris sp.]|nr:hypothetical protein [Oscillochloris sp.]
MVGFTTIGFFMARNKHQDCGFWENSRAQIAHDPRLESTPALAQSGFVISNIRLA